MSDFEVVLAGIFYILRFSSWSLGHTCVWTNLDPIPIMKLIASPFYWNHFQISSSNWTFFNPIPAPKISLNSFQSRNRIQTHSSVETDPQSVHVL